MMRTYESVKCNNYIDHMMQKRTRENNKKW